MGPMSRRQTAGSGGRLPVRCIAVCNPRRRGRVPAAMWRGGHRRPRPEHPFDNRIFPFTSCPPCHFRQCVLLAPTEIRISIANVHPMAFEWDEKKRRHNLARHGVDFRDAARIWNSYVLECQDDRKIYGEERHIALGQADGQYFVVVYTWRDGSRRLISAWKVGEDGRQRYQALLSRRTQ